jgi:hypothetical protein
MQKFVKLKRLGDEIGGAAADGIHRILHRSIAGHDDADDIGIAEQGRFKHTRAVEAGQSEVRDHDIKGKFCEVFDGAFARLGLHHLKTLLSQTLGQRFAERRLIFDKQKMFLRFSHLESVNIMTHRELKSKLEVKNSTDPTVP